jgi:hypothetical protein
MKLFYGRIRQMIKNEFWALSSKPKRTKVFCIGQNKTGTTSLKHAFIDFGFRVNDQRIAESLIDDYLNGNFKTIISYCRYYDFFQDIPFSCLNTFKELDAAYPNSKFILTIRDSDDQWYKSLTKFHAKLLGNGNIPTSDILKNHPYRYKGWFYKAVIDYYGTSQEDPYDEKLLKLMYHRHNMAALKHFENRPSDFLVLNLAEKGSYLKLCEFLQLEPLYQEFPWKNKT